MYEKIASQTSSIAASPLLVNSTVTSKVIKSDRLALSDAPRAFTQPFPLRKDNNEPVPS